MERGIEKVAHRERGGERPVEEGEEERGREGERDGYILAFAGQQIGHEPREPGEGDATGEGYEEVPDAEMIATSAGVAEFFDGSEDDHGCKGDGGSEPRYVRCDMCRKRSDNYSDTGAGEEVEKFVGSGFILASFHWRRCLMRWRMSKTIRAKIERATARSDGDEVL